VLAFMLGSPCDLLQNHPIEIDGVKVQNKSSQPAQSRGGGLLRVAASSNPLVNLTRYCRRCKPGLRQTVHHRGPGLQRLPLRSGYLER
jgi:hypothetical protein